MQQKLVQNFFATAGAFGNNIGNEPQKPRPNFTNMYIIYLLRIFVLPAIQCK